MTRCRRLAICNGEMYLVKNNPNFANNNIILVATTLARLFALYPAFCSIPVTYTSGCLALGPQIHQNSNAISTDSSEAW